MAFPEVVSRERWLEARRALLAEEKAETRRRDVLNTKRRMLPMVRIDKAYVFDGPRGSAALAELDLTALGRQEAWEAPKSRAPVLQVT
jgi:predicted dithiol-disulfide oxidoreductase (DUF899 family)